MPASGKDWSYANARKAKQKADDQVAALEARIKRLEEQLLDLGQDPVP